MDLEHKSIERIKMASDMALTHYGKPIVCTYSGGKDSDVMLELFLRSGVPFEIHNSHTTVDAPQTVYHIRQKFKELENKGIKCEIERPPINKADPQKRRLTMEFDCKEKISADTVKKVLLRDSERRLLSKSYDCDGCSLEGKQRQGVTRRI